MSERTTDTTPLDPGSPHGRGVAERPSKGTERRLWFSILAPPAAWTIAQLASYSVVGRVCGDHARASSLESWQYAAVLGIPAAMALVTLAALLVALGTFRRWSGNVRITEAEGWNRVEYMAIAGAIISFFLLINIIYFGIMPLIVDPCLRVT